MENVVNLQLMMKDKLVMNINFDIALYEVVDEKLLPYQMQGKLRNIPDFSEIKTRYDDIQRQIAIRKNYDAVLSFLATRTLPISRENAKKIYGLFGFEQLQDDLSKAKIAIICRALSLQDNYWLKLEGDTVTWNEVNLRNKSLSEAVAQVALHGSSLTLQDKAEEALHTPELTGQGAYAKAWKRYEDGLYLQKMGAKDPTEARIEVMVSNILDNCNVDHLPYRAGKSNDIYVCECKCMIDDNTVILSGMDFDTYCNVHGLDSRKEALKIDPEAIYKMWIVDYLISNRDRHGLNWGFFCNSDTMEILGCHPLYDHNNAFDIPLMQNKDAEYLYDNSMTMKQAAEIAMKHVDFHFYREFTRKDFITDRQYESFMDRAKELGIKVIPREAEINNGQKAVLTLSHSEIELD